MPRKTVSPSKVHHSFNNNILTLIVLGELIIPTVVFATGNKLSMPANTECTLDVANYFSYLTVRTDQDKWIPLWDSPYNNGGNNYITIVNNATQGGFIYTDGSHSGWGGYQTFSPSGFLDIKNNLTMGSDASCINIDSTASSISGLNLKVYQGVTISNSNSSTNATIKLSPPTYLSQNITIDNYGDIVNNNGIVLDTRNFSQLVLNQRQGSLIGTITCSTFATNNINIYGGTIKSTIAGIGGFDTNNLNFYTDYTIDQNINPSHVNIGNFNTTNLTIVDNANINDSNVLNLRNIVNMQGGSIAATINNLGTFNISGGNIAGSKTLTNNSYSTTNISGGIVDMSISNSGVLNISADADVTSTINNSGTVNISGGMYSGRSGATNSLTNNSGQSVNISGGSIDVPINNSGTLNISGGSISGGNTLTNNTDGTTGITGGSISIPISNAGALTISGGTVSGANALINNNTLTISGGTVSAPITNTSGTMTIQTGANVSSTINNSDILNISGGTVSGNNTITNNKTLTISGGTVSAPITNTSGTMTIQTGANVSSTINNSDILNISGGTVSSNNTITNNKTLNISGGTVSAPITNNTGGTTTIQTGANISSPINLQSGTLQFSGGSTSGTITGANSSGDLINISSNITLPTVNNVNNITVNAGATLTVNNTISGLNNKFNNNTSATTNIISGSSVSGSGVLDNSGTLNISGGTVNLAINNSAALNISGGTVFGSNTLTNKNNGTLNISGGTVNLPISNNSGGTITVKSGGNISGGNTLSNSGTLEIQSGGTIGAPISLNSGTVNFTGGSATNTITGANSNSDNINISSNTTLPTVTNVNNITVSSGTTTVSSAITGVNHEFNNNSGATTNIISAASITGSGTLKNAGTLNVGSSSSVSSGSVNMPINNTGTMNVNNQGSVFGGSTLTNSGILNIQLGGSISAPISLSNGTINFKGGSATGTITGANSNSDNITISSDTTLPIITNVNNITVTTGTTTVNKAVTGVNNQFNNNSGVTTNVVGGGSISGRGTLQNAGTLNIGSSSPVSAGTVSMPINNTGIVNVNNSGTISGTGTVTNSGTLTVNIGGTISTSGTVTNSSVLDLEGGTVTSSINNQASGLLIVGKGSSISSGTSLTNAGTLQANPGGTISIPITFDPVNGGMVNLAGGYITDKITGHGLSTDVVNILADGNSAQMLSQVNNVGNIFVNTNNFTINTAMKGINYNFITGYGSNVTIFGGGDLSGNGAISNAGVLSVSGGTIGADSPMGNVINSGTFDVAGNVKVRNFTNGINQPAGAALLTAIETINIVVNSNGQPDGNSGSSPAGVVPILAPTESVTRNPIYAMPGSAINVGSNNNITLLDPNYTSQNNPNPDLVTLIANQGTLNFSGTKPANVSVKGLGSSIIYLQGPIGDINSYIASLQFTPTFKQYGKGTVTITLNDNASGGIDNNTNSISAKESLNLGTLNITSNSMTARNVTNTYGYINITGSGDLSCSNNKKYDITNLAYASDAVNNPTVNTNIITISGSGTIGKDTSFNNIINNGILIVKDAASTVTATTIQLQNTNGYTTNTSGIMTTSGIINADIKFSSNEILNIGGGAINNSITGLDTTKASTINVFGKFATSKDIANINNINVTNSTNGVGDFTINNEISGLNTKFSTEKGAMVTINSSGKILGTGIINNAGTMTIASPATTADAASIVDTDVIGTSTAPMGAFTNKGAVNLNANNIYITGFTNNDASAILNISGGLLTTGVSNFSNTAGTVNISNGKIASNQVNNSDVINIKNTGLINAPIANSGNLNLYATDGNVGNITNKLNSVAGTINVNAGGVLNNNLAIAGGTINLNTGGIINIPISFDSQGGTLNLVGGTLNNNVTSSLAIGSGIGVVNVKADYTYDSAHTINNISQFNVASGTTNINAAITNINTSASVAQGATMIVNNQGNIFGNATGLTNSGTITLNTGGTLSLPILFGSNGGTLNLSGGYLTTSIGGANSSGKGTINLTAGTNYSDFDQNISNIDTINVQGNSFSINDPITRINTAFNVAQTAAVTINTNGYLSGNGSINNNGIITLSGGTIGIVTDKIGKINNSGTINVNNNIYVAGNIINNNNAVATSSSGGVGIFDVLPAVASGSVQAATGIIVNRGGNIYGGANSILQNYGIVTLNKEGTINIPINFGTIDVGVLNLSGGTVNGSIQGGDGISTSAGTINVNVDTTYTGSSYTIDHVNNINVNNTSTFTIKSNILGVNNIFSTASAATAIIQNGAQIEGGGVVANAGNLYVQNGSLGSSTHSFVNVQNNGALKVDSSGSIYAAAINHNGSMTTFGNIHAPILFGSNITQLTIGGGSISGVITGYNSDPNAVGNANVINIIGNFSTSNNINDVGSINVNKGIFTIYNPIAGLGDVFATAYNTTTNLNNNSSINGAGIINNIGTINVLFGGSIGIVNTNFNNIYNDGAFNINTGGTVIVNNIYNGILAPSNANAVSSQGLFNIYGNISINVSALNLNIDLNSQSITGALPGTQTTPENTSLTFSAANKNAITLTGIDDNGGTVQLTAAHGSLSIPSANTANLTNMSGNNSNTLVMAGSLNNLNNALQGLVFTPDANYVGTDANIEIYLHNNQVVSADDSATSITVEQPPVGYIPTFTVNGGTLQTNVLDNISNFIINGGTDNLGAVTNHAANAVLNIAGGTVTATSVTNTLGAINISGGDLSSASVANASPLTNAAGQTITISGTGTLGFNQAFGDITNNGIVQSTGTNLASGNNITIGKFTNNALGAELDISGGKVAAGNISNTLGAINISGGDLSSASAVTPSTLINAAGQTITVSGTGTIGFNRALGNVTNNGILQSTGTNLASGNNITVGNFANNATGAELNISGGKVAAGNISNTLGTMNISGGDLSSASSANPSTLTNAAGQVMTISGTGTIGVNRSLGIFNNQGLFNVFGGNISASTLSNSGIVNMVQPATISNGNYTVTSAGMHIVDIDVNNNPATLNLANGTATLQANATIYVKYNGDVLVPNNHVYNVITSTNTPITPGLDASNNITGVNIAGSTDLVYYTPYQSGNNIQVVSHRKLIEDIVDNVGNYTANPAATVLDDLINSGVVTGDLRTALARLDGLGTDQEVSDAVNQLLPEASITADIGFIAPSMTFSTITERAELIARSPIENQTGYAYGDASINNSFWVKGFGGSIQQKQKVTTAGYTASTAGVAFGLDNQLLENTWVGLGFSTVNTHINSKDVSAKKTTVVTQQATLYSSYSPENYYIDSLLAMAFNSYKLQRNIVYNNLNYRSQAAYNSIQPAAKIAAGYIYNVNPIFKIIPNLSLQYSLLRQSTYTEYGAGNLSLRDVTSPILTQLEGGAGVKFSFLQEQDEQIYKPELHFMVLHDFKSTAQTTTAQFIGGGGTFKVTGTQPNKTSYTAGLGFTAVHQDQFNFTLRYDFKYRNKFIGHSGYLAVRYMF